jgi:hypothetical protein
MVRNFVIDGTGLSKEEAERLRTEMPQLYKRYLDAGKTHGRINADVLAAILADAASGTTGIDATTFDGVVPDEMMPEHADSVEFTGSIPAVPDDTSTDVPDDTSEEDATKAL